jgi:hypothetical protein
LTFLTGTDLRLGARSTRAAIIRCSQVIKRRSYHHELCGWGAQAFGSRSLPGGNHSSNDRMTGCSIRSGSRSKLKCRSPRRLQQLPCHSGCCCLSNRIRTGFDKLESLSGPMIPKLRSKEWPIMLRLARKTLLTGTKKPDSAYDYDDDHGEYHCVFCNVAPLVFAPESSCESCHSVTPFLVLLSVVRRCVRECTSASPWRRPDRLLRLRCRRPTFCR